MDYSRIMKFKGNWRTYQARVLANANKYLEDGRVHIVAAPGSGKTTLGIELISRLGMPALVLAPSITIREQWAARIAEGFLNDDVNPEDYISMDLKNPRVITIVTYQSLHAAMNKYKGIQKEESQMSEESDDVNPCDSVDVDYSAFDVVKTMKECNLGVICLDECHHLRSEWWKALEDFKAQMNGLKVIALTATPPYDSTPAMWDRYMSMCGEIDEEITIPELVKEGSLCPHQDYVYFNYPTEDEMEAVNRFYQASDEIYEFLMTDENFKQAIGSHMIFRDQINEDQLLEHENLFSALLVFAKAKNMTINPQLYRLLGVKDVPPMSKEWMQMLLTGFLYEDSEAFGVWEDYKVALEDKLKAAGLIEKKKIYLVSNPSLEKLLMSSKGKCNSIKDIVSYEYFVSGKSLRLLVLTDYIRKEHEKNLGVENADVTSLGVLPFFEQIRRSQQGSALRLGVLCGTIVIIPAEAKAALEATVEGRGKITFSKVGSLEENDYVKVSAVGDNHFLTGAVTDIFSQGYMQVLVGTKSLLGEGWDSPCINSLILASVVGSFMLSNQMRGRAIRTMRDNPDKASNIWHLVCVPQRAEEESEDFALLERRMDHYLGLHYTEDSIESGMARLSYIEPPFDDEENIKRINKKMLELSGKRGALKNRWNSALVKMKEVDIVESTTVVEDGLSTYAFRTALTKTMAPALVAGASLWGFFALAAAGVTIAPVLLPVAAVAGVGVLTKVPKTLAVSNSQKRFLVFGKGLRKALVQAKLFEDEKSQVEVKQDRNGYAVFLVGGTTKDKKLFAQCMKEAFGPVVNQRYLLVEQGGIKKMTSYYCVPEVFGKRKEDAQGFYDCIKEYIGKYELIYTRNEAGRKILVEGRIAALGNQKGYQESVQRVNLK